MPESSTQTFCTQCGRPIRSKSAFCTGCGSALQAKPAALSASFTPPQPAPVPEPSFHKPSFHVPHCAECGGILIPGDTVCRQCNLKFDYPVPKVLITPELAEIAIVHGNIRTVDPIASPKSEPALSPKPQTAPKVASEPRSGSPAGFLWGMAAAVGILFFLVAHLTHPVASPVSASSAETSSAAPTADVSQTQLPQSAPQMPMPSMPAPIVLRPRYPVAQTTGVSGSPEASSSGITMQSEPPDNSNIMTSLDNPTMPNPGPTAAEIKLGNDDAAEAQREKDVDAHIQAADNARKRQDLVSSLQDAVRSDEQEVADHPEDRFAQDQIRRDQDRLNSVLAGGNGD